MLEELELPAALDVGEVDDDELGAEPDEELDDEVDDEEHAGTNPLEAITNVEDVLSKLQAIAMTPSPGFGRIGGKMSSTVPLLYDN